MVLTTASLRKRLKLWQLLQILIALLLTAWLLVVCVQLMNKTFAYLNASQQTVGRILIEHLARQAMPLLQEEQQPQLQQLVESYASDANIHDVVIYNALGEPLAQSAPALPIASLLDLTDTENTGAMPHQGPTPYVTTISKHGTPLGYVRLTVNNVKLSGLSEDYLKYGVDALLKLGLGTLVIGFLLTRSFYRKRHRWSSHGRGSLVFANNPSLTGRRWSTKK